MVGSTVHHNTFGSGTIVEKAETCLTIDFDGVLKRFVYPDALGVHLSCSDEDLMAQALRDQEAKRRAQVRTSSLGASSSPDTQKPSAPKRRRRAERPNVAFKCNYCDGGRSATCVGFNGICSEPVLRYNIEKAHHVWCSDPGSPCRRYLDGAISRDSLEGMLGNAQGGSFVCYESQMLRDWRACAGVNRTGENRGMPRRIRNVQHNSLAVLTTREPNLSEESRFVFAVFLVDESYEGDCEDYGYVTTRSKWKISLVPQEARKIRFWNYYRNSNAPEKIVFASGLYRFLSDEQAIQILKDIASIRIRPEDREFANRFLEYFCTVNCIDIDQVPPPSGALTLQH